VYSTHKSALSCCVCGNTVYESQRKMNIDIFQAAGSGNLNEVKLFLEKDGDVNTKDLVSHGFISNDSSIEYPLEF
jgi:hypothetical protein